MTSKVSIPSFSSAFSALFTRRPSSPAKLAPAKPTPPKPLTPPTNADRLEKAATELRSMPPSSPETVYQGWQDSIDCAMLNAEAVIASLPVQEEAKLEAFHCAVMARSLNFLLLQKRGAVELKLAVTTPAGANLEMVMHVGATVAALRVAVRALISSRSGNDVLYFKGLRLQEDKTLGFYGMTNGCRVHFLTFAPCTNA